MVSEELVFIFYCFESDSAYQEFETTLEAMNREIKQVLLFLHEKSELRDLERIGALWGPLQTWMYSIGAFYKSLNSFTDFASEWVRR